VTLKTQVTCPPGEPVILMTRTFDAPRRAVWAAFTDPKHVAQWYGGHGFANPVCEMDVRPGGRWRHVMRTPDGIEHAMELVFVEVVKPEKLVWKHADAKGSPPPDFRNTMTVTLEEDGDRTRWTLVTRFASVAARDAAIEFGFAAVIAEGAEKLNDLAMTIDIVQEKP
jgi:uncharacterized protein YndB with AHSA1/START domain